MHYALSAVKWVPTSLFVIGSWNWGNSAEQIKHNKGESALEKYPDLFNKVKGLRKDISIQTPSNAVSPCYKKMVTPMNSFRAVGSNVVGQAMIFVDKDLEEIDKDAFGFLFKYECAHINFNEELFSSVLVILAATVTAFAVPLIISSWPVLLPFLVSFITGVSCKLFAEVSAGSRAINFAYTHATSEEILGIKRFYEIQIELHKSLREKYPARSVEEGNTRIELSNKAVIRLRKIQDEEERNNKMVIDYYKNNNCHEQIKILEEANSLKKQTNLIDKEESEIQNKIKKYILDSYVKSGLVDEEAKNDKNLIPN